MKLSLIVAALITTLAIFNSACAEESVSLPNMKLHADGGANMFDLSSLDYDTPYAVTCKIYDRMANLGSISHEDGIYISAMSGHLDRGGLIRITVGSQTSNQELGRFIMMRADAGILMKIENVRKWSYGYTDTVYIENSFNNGHTLSVESCVAAPSGPKSQKTA